MPTPTHPLPGVCAVAGGPPPRHTSSATPSTTQVSVCLRAPVAGRAPVQYRNVHARARARARSILSPGVFFCDRRPLPTSTGHPPRRQLAIPDCDNWCSEIGNWGLTTLFFVCFNCITHPVSNFYPRHPRKVEECTRKTKSKKPIKK